ncbi:MAG: hypothetical protein AAGM22_02705 [Acidobacteriota bacterium]
MLVFTKDEAGRELTVAIQRHVSVCPDCAEVGEHTRRIVTIVRRQCIRETAPETLRERIVARLRNEN